MENDFRLKVVKVFQKVINSKTNNVFISISIYVNKKAPLDNGAFLVYADNIACVAILLCEHAVTLPRRRLPRRL